MLSVWNILVFNKSFWMYHLYSFPNFLFPRKLIVNLSAYLRPEQYCGKTEEFLTPLMKKHLKKVIFLHLLIKHAFCILGNWRIISFPIVSSLKTAYITTSYTVHVSPGLLIRFIIFTVIYY